MFRLQASRPIFMEFTPIKERAPNDSPGLVRRLPGTLDVAGGRPPDASVCGVADLLAASLAAQDAADYDQAIALAGQAAARAAADGDVAAEAAARRQLANQLLRSGANEDAARACEQACCLFESIDAAAEHADTLNELTLIYVTLGLHTEALDSVTKSLSIAQRRGDPRMMYWAYNRAGVVRNNMDDPVHADELMRQALDLAGGLGNPEKFCILNNLADNAHALVKTLRERGETVAAMDCVRQGVSHALAALSLVEDGKHPYQESLVLSNLGYLLGIEGAYDRAMPALQRAYALAVAHGYANLELTADHYTAQVFLLRGDQEEGIRLLHKALHRAELNQEKPVVAKINLQLSEAYVKRGEATRALEHFRAFHEVEREFNTHVAQTRARLMGNLFEVETSRVAVERSRQEAEVLRARSAALEAEKRELQRRAEELGRVAHEDPLTGLWNRRYLDSRLPDMFARLKDSGRPICIASCDIDFFKSVNDRFGHAVGDAVLVQTARLLSGGARQSDLVARTGGEEFCIVFPHADLAAATRACERLRGAIARHPWARLGEGLAVTISIGVACGSHSSELKTVLLQADTLLYQAKQNGRNRVESSRLAI
jgi:diguanylate cyclase (GGDEF)-like protein